MKKLEIVLCNEHNIKKVASWEKCNFIVSMFDYEFVIGIKHSLFCFSNSDIKQLNSFGLTMDGLLVDLKYELEEQFHDYNHETIEPERDASIFRISNNELLWKSENIILNFKTFEELSSK